MIIEPSPATFDEMCDALGQLVAGQSAMLAELARAAVAGNTPPIDLEAMRERIGVLAQIGRLLRALINDEREVREIAERRAEWVRLVAQAATAQADERPTHVVFRPVIHETEPRSEFEAIGLACRDAARNELNNLPGLKALADSLPHSAGVDALLRQIHRRAALVHRAAVIFEELAPKERETRALLPGLPMAASGSNGVPKP